VLEWGGVERSVRQFLYPELSSLGYLRLCQNFPVLAELIFATAVRLRRDERRWEYPDARALVFCKVEVMLFRDVRLNARVLNQGKGCGK
jgi:hypothetical protein